MSGLPPRGLTSPDAILRPLAEIRTTNSINLQLPPTCGAKQLAKLKRFLTTLQQFGSDISAEIGERVRSLVLALVVSNHKHQSLMKAENVTRVMSQHAQYNNYCVAMYQIALRLL